MQTATLCLLALHPFRIFPIFYGEMHMKLIIMHSAVGRCCICLSVCPSHSSIMAQRLDEFSKFIGEELPYTRCTIRKFGCIQNMGTSVLDLVRSFEPILCFFSPRNVDRRKCCQLGPSSVPHTEWPALFTLRHTWRRVSRDSSVTDAGTCTNVVPTFDLLTSFSSHG